MDRRMMDVYVTKTTFKKNDTDGIKLHKSLYDLAESVHEDEQYGGVVQVFILTPVDHEVYAERVSIDLSKPK